jgi:hypothetical protein
MPGDIKITGEETALATLEYYMKEDAEIKANGRVIEAAPDMLRLLEEAVKDLEFPPETERVLLNPDLREKLVAAMPNLEAWKLEAWAILRRLELMHADQVRADRVYKERGLDE